MMEEREEMDDVRLNYSSIIMVKRKDSSAPE